MGMRSTVLRPMTALGLGVDLEIARRAATKFAKIGEPWKRPVRGTDDALIANFVGDVRLRPVSTVRRDMFEVEGQLTLRARRRSGVVDPELTMRD